jgi:nucleoside-diphosphate-sugar epimerase
VSVLVTGATGFVGRHLVRCLSMEGARVVAAVRDVARRPAAAPPVVALPFDLAQTEQLRPEALAGIECIYHLAAHVHVMRPSPLDRERFTRLNVGATRSLAERAAAAGVKRFVYLSSIKVNGEFTPPHKQFSARDRPAPVDAYGRSKCEAEHSLTEIARTTGLEIVIIRPPLVYGPGVGANFRRLIQLVQSGWPLPLGAVGNRRSLVSLWNLASLLVHVRTRAEAAGRTWLVSDDDDASTPRLLQAIARALGKPQLRLISMPVPALRAMGRVLGRSAEVARLIDSLQVDISDTRSVLDWKPVMGLDEGIERTVASFREAHRAMD